MEMIPFSQARENLADVVNSVRFGHKRYALTRHGKQVAAVISMEDLALLERVIEEIEDAIDVKEGEKALQRAKKEGTIPFEQVIKDLDLNV